MLFKIFRRPLPFTRKDDEEFLATYIQTRYVKQLERIERIPEKRQQEILDTLLEPHRSRWYFTWRVVILVPVLLMLLLGLDRVQGFAPEGEAMLLNIIVKLSSSFAIVFIIFYSYKHYDLWRIAKSDLVKTLIESKI